MSYRFKLLSITCLTYISITPHVLAGVSLQSKGVLESDRRLAQTMMISRKPVATINQQINQQIAASPATASPNPRPSAPAAQSSPTPARPAASPSPAVPAASVTPASPASPAASPVPSAAPAASTKDWIWWGTIGIVPIGIVAAVLYLLRPKPEKPTTSKQKNKPSSARAAVHASLSQHGSQSPEGDTGVEHQPTDEVSAVSNNGEISNGNDVKVDRLSESDRTTDANQKDLTISTTTRLARVDIIEALIHDLHKPDPGQRRKAIWELGQRGDSRAIQPLVDLLVDADSTQRGLILAAVTEISIRNLKPLNRALMLSMQDGSPDVRKNALRDVTRVFELVAQTSQLLQYAASDGDTEVRETAEWALGQLNRMRPALGAEAMPSLSQPVQSASRLSSLRETSLMESSCAEVPLHSQEETDPSKEQGRTDSKTLNRETIL